MEDQLVRAMSDSGAFRVLSAVTTGVVSEAVARQGLSPPVAEAFGRLITGVALIRSTIHPGERMQVTMQHNGTAGDLMVDGWPDGMLRGYAKNPDASPNSMGRVVGDVGVVDVARSRTQGDGKMHQSITMMITGTIQDELQLFLLESEQIASHLILEVHVEEDGTVQWSGGVLVQLLPGTEVHDLAQVIPRIEGMGSLRDIAMQGGHAAMLAAVLPDGHSLTIVGNETLYYGCTCSEERVLGSLASLSRDDIAEMLRDGEMIELTCGFCQRTHRVAPERLRALLATN